MSLNEELTVLLYKYGLSEVKREFDIVYNDVINKYISELTTHGFTVHNSVPAVAVEAAVVEESVPVVTEATQATQATEATELSEEPVPVKEEKKFNITEYKKWQRQQEKSRKEYMKQNKISLKELFTKENIEQWLSEGKTYAHIAREYLGIKQDTISAFAKQHGIDKKKSTT
jgi:hypothetical protein